jgi:wobble nucleotide-excising tRNase
LLYGRNYSGKTTLSQIVRAMETGVVPEHYKAAAFTVHMSDGDVTEAQIATKYNVRVYNRDFVETHLSFLRRADGKIMPFAVVGLENRLIEKQIREKTDEIGSVEERTGLRHDLSNADANYTGALQVSTNAARTLEEILINKANAEPGGIKHNRVYGDANYDKRELRKDIALVGSGGDHRLSEADALQQSQLIGQAALPPCGVKVELTSNFPAIVATATELMARKITPSEAMKDLLNDAELQAWVKEGIPLHREKRTSCGFCQQVLPPELWQKLDAHFNAAVNTLLNDIAACQELIQQERDALTRVKHVARASVYAGHHVELERLDKELTDNIALHRSTVDLLAETLRLRAVRIFEPQQAPPTPNYGNNVVTIGATINALVEASNATTRTLEDQKTQGRRKLLLNEVAKFVTDINYAATAAKNQELVDAAQALVAPRDELKRRVQLLEDEIQSLRARLNDEGAAAERVNTLLRSHFGHEGLRLETFKPEGSSKYLFQIVRDNEIAHNLSEGECSLIAFCYFMAKLQEPETLGTRPIIWIDDPISSLDANHIFFVFSLIESLLGRPQKNATAANEYSYLQLFVTTHNLEFLKYLGRLTRQGRKSDHLRYFLVAKRAQGSVIEWMPEYLRRYTTEFNYLFGEICTCTDAAKEATHHQSFYNFGNNLRRFLEAYLFFKYPLVGTDEDGRDFEHHMNQFFGKGTTETVRLHRLVNEYSHSRSFDRAAQPMDRDEIAQVARFVFAKLKAAHGSQYDCLLKSIGKTCPL